MNLSPDIQHRAMDCARGIADWLCMVQAPNTDDFPPSGQFPWIIHPDGRQIPANSWNYAFAIMGLLHAAEVFRQPRYEQAALAMGNYLKGLQILDPFHPDDYGAIREITPYTRWCYTRDALSAAWAFIELYRHTHDTEYLTRARLWGEWFLLKGCDVEGWPYWGHTFEPLYEAAKVEMHNDIQGCFQGGSLNFLHQLYLASGESKWIGSSMQKIANLLVQHIQQPSGFYASIERTTHRPPASDPSNNLHRANDDLASLGLLSAFKTTQNRAYLTSIEKFVRAVFEEQREDGRFEDSVASIPVVLNVLLEGNGMLQTPLAIEEAKIRALEALMASQSDGRFNPLMRGGILEGGETHKHKVNGKLSFVCARSSCYALIVLLKLTTGRQRFLCID